MRMGLEIAFMVDLIDEYDAQQAQRAHIASRRSRRSSDSECRLAAYQSLTAPGCKVTEADPEFEASEAARPPGNTSLPKLTVRRRHGSRTTFINISDYSTRRGGLYSRSGQLPGSLTMMG